MDEREVKFDLEEVIYMIRKAIVKAMIEGDLALVDRTDLQERNTRTLNKQSEVPILRLTDKVAADVRGRLTRMEDS